ncbi:MAG: PorV/PorQ family protein, partial [candidate division WOR-3 bacterium]
MFKNKIIITLTLTSILSLYAQDTLSYDYALDFLKLGVAARACAMGEAFVAVADDGSAYFWNPAGLGSLSNPSIMFTHAEWLFDTRFECLGGSLPFKFGTFTPHIMYLGSGEIERTDQYGREIGTYENYDIAAGIAYGIQPEKGLHFGFTAKFIYEKLDNYYASGLSFGIGFLYRTPIGLSLGLSGMNIGKGVKFIDTRNNQPLTIRFGLAYQGSVHSLDFIPALDLVYDRNIKINLGCEIVIVNILAIRGGYRIGLNQQCFTAG